MGDFCDVSAVTKLDSNRIVGAMSSSFFEQRDASVALRPKPAKLERYFDDDSSAETSASEFEPHLRVYLRTRRPKIGTRTSEYPSYECASRNELVVTSTKPSFVKSYRYTHVFDGSTQRDVFDRVIRDDLAKFVNANDFTVMTYGTSGSGKTYSLIGTESEPGVVPRTLEALFAAIEVETMPAFKPNDDDSFDELDRRTAERELQKIQSTMKNSNADSGLSEEDLNDSLDSYRRMSTFLQDETDNWHYLKKSRKKYEAWISFIEIYNESIYDILGNDSQNRLPPRLRLMQLPNKKSYIKGAKWVYVRNGIEAFAVLEKGKRRLRYASTSVNSQSSRAHCLFSIKLVQYNSGLNDISVSTFRLCDLAGSERVKKTGNEGTRLNESCKINSSLHVLERCLASLCKQQDGHQTLPPYRESKLTSLLQNALSGNESIVLLVTINTDPLFFDETLHVLQFSAIAKKLKEYIQPKEVFREKPPSYLDLAEQTFYRKENERIKEEYELKLINKDREVRQQLGDYFTKMLKNTHYDFEDRLTKDRERHKELFESLMEYKDEQIKTMTDQIKNMSNQIKNLVTENILLKSRLEKEDRINGNTSGDSTMPNDNNNSTLSSDKQDISINSTKEDTFNDNSFDSSVCSDACTPNTIIPQSENLDLQDNFVTPTKNDQQIEEHVECKENIFSNKFHTEKKEGNAKLYIDNVCSTVGASRRKLFTKRENNEMAAETKEPLKSSKQLNFEESPGLIIAPKMEKPYVCDKPSIRSLRKKK